MLRVFELIGQQLGRDIKGLADYSAKLSDLASASPLAADLPSKWPEYHTEFGALFEEMRQARNDAVHQGAHARTLTDHAVELSIILEDALMTDASKVSQFMVRDVVDAKLWHPLSYIRQQMLTHAFSYLPIWHADAWNLSLNTPWPGYYVMPHRKLYAGDALQRLFPIALQTAVLNCWTLAKCVRRRQLRKHYSSSASDQFSLLMECTRMHSSDCSPRPTYCEGRSRRLSDESVVMNDARNRPPGPLVGVKGCVILGKSTSSREGSPMKSAAWTAVVGSLNALPPLRP